MSRSRGTAVATALLWAALAAAGCGIGPGESVGEVKLTVTRDYGSAPVLSLEAVEVNESDSVMRVLDREADLSTRYSGAFVEAIEGLAAERRGGRAWDWLYYVNGVEATVGAADFELRGGEEIWWDYRDWSAALRVPAVVGSWPQPFSGGYEGRRRSTVLECLGGGVACRTVRGRLRRAGARLVSDSSDEAIRVLVGPWARLRGDAAAAQIEAGPEESGVFADFDRSGARHRLIGLDESGEEARVFGPGAGLVAATRRFEGPPVWVVTGATPAGVSAAASILSRVLRDSYAAAIEGRASLPTPLPLQ